MKPSILFSLLALALMALVIYLGMRRPPTAAAPTTVPQSAAAIPMPTVPPIYLTVTAPLPPTPTPPLRQAISRMALPQNYRANFDLYAIVDRSDSVTRKLYISHAAVDAVRAGRSFPDGTEIIVEAYNAQLDANGQPMRDAQGHLIAGAFDPEIHISEMRSDWQPADLIPNTHTGSFNFDAFDFSSGQEHPAGRSDCFNCHQSAFSTGFVYSLRLIDQYAFTGMTQYFNCPLPDRLPCPL